MALALFQECYLGVVIISLENTFLENIYINKSEEERDRERQRDRDREKVRELMTESLFSFRL